MSMPYNAFKVSALLKLQQRSVLRYVHRGWDGHVSFPGSVFHFQEPDVHREI